MLSLIPEELFRHSVPASLLLLRCIHSCRRLLVCSAGITGLALEVLSQLPENALLTQRIEPCLITTNSLLGLLIPGTSG